MIKSFAYAMLSYRCSRKDYERNKVMRLTPLKALRLECLDRCRGSSYVVSKCDISDCALHYYRYGKNPKRGVWVKIL